MASDMTAKHWMGTDATRTLREAMNIQIGSIRIQLCP